jgi:hypothetical protein
VIRNLTGSSGPLRHVVNALCCAAQQVVAYDMLRGAIHGLTLSSNTIFQGDLITLIREILVRAPLPLPRQFPCSMPSRHRGLAYR